MDPLCSLPFICSYFLLSQWILERILATFFFFDVVRLWPSGPCLAAAFVRHGLNKNVRSFPGGSSYSKPFGPLQELVRGSPPSRAWCPCIACALKLPPRGFSSQSASAVALFASLPPFLRLPSQITPRRRPAAASARCRWPPFRKATAGYGGTVEF